MLGPKLELHALAGSPTHDLPTLDPESLVAASYLQLLHPGEWTLVPCSDPSRSPSGSFPVLKHGADEFTGSGILNHLLQTSQSSQQVKASDEKAFQALLDRTVLPLVLHSLYSLPNNWHFTRSLLVPSLPFPTNFYRPGQLRQAAHDLIDATHPNWWGLGGEAEKEEEAERRRKRALLESGTEGIKERRDETRREGKERVKKTFGEGKIVSAARAVFTALETTLAASSTPFFFSSSSPTPLDAHLSALLSLVLYLPLPQPLLADLINASFPRLWAHSALLRRTLWSPESAPPPSTPSASSASSSSPPSFLPGLRDIASLPSTLLSSFGLSSTPLKRGGKPVASRKPLSKQEKDFQRKRWAFYAVCAVGVVGWGVGTGAFPLPGGRLGRLLGRSLSSGGDEEDGEWEEVDEDGEDGEEEEFDDEE
ncbi:hypothetical protein JCM8547_000718 [Rhodosporidiobolus lusitaniae]